MNPAVGSARTLAWLSPALLLLTVVGIVIWVYQPGLKGPLLFDDFHTIEPLLALDSLPRQWSSLLFSHTGELGRPVAMASFLLDLYLWGNNLYAWKATNLLLHLLCGMAIFCFANHLFDATSRQPQSSSRIAAAYVAVAWLLHPLQVSTVLYTVQRMTQLSALFTFAGLAVYLWSRKKWGAGQSERVAFLLPYVLFTPLAVLSKENGVLLPVFILALECVLPRPASPEMKAQRTYQLLVFLGLPVLVGAAYLATGGWQGIVDGYSVRDFSLSERLMTQARVLFMYAHIILAPTAGNLGFFHDDLVISHGLLEPASTLISLLALGLLAIVPIFIRKKSPVVAFGVAFFLIGHLIESTVISLDMMFEHRNYLPSCGLLIATAGLFSAITTPRARRLVFVSVASVVLLFAAIASARTSEWSTEATMYVSFYRAHPRSPHAASQFAQILAAQGIFREANLILADVPGSGARIQRWHLACLENKKIERSAMDLSSLDRERALKAYPIVGLTELSKLALDGKCEVPRDMLESALETALAKPIAQVRWRANLSLYLAQVRWASGKKDAALRVLQDASSLIAEDPIPWLLMAEWKVELGDRAGAERALERGRANSLASGKDYSGLVRAVEKIVSNSPH